MERIKALVQRELKRMTVSPSWLVTMTVQPVAYLALFALGLSGQFGSVTFLGKELSYLEFLLPGLLALQTNQLFHVLVSLASADRRFGVFPLVMMAGTKTWEYVVAEVISHSLVTATQGMLILIVGLALMGKPPSPSASGVGIRAGIALAAWLASLVLWSTVGLMVGLRIEREEKRDVLWALLNLPLMFSSSVFYDVSRAPAFIRILSYINPLTYCADALRISMYDDLVGAIWRIGVLIGLASTFAALCLRVVRTTPLIRTIG